ncbi:bifunctional proline dehydrogenase/L-glutamate gamma-semialdehyde dehydrogenase PutA [Emcibacter sp.]|uniref:bifunctional proline dehydrogenase/L-glutamate gamma-semialdehyde dehydrogenase PutA n=1 Tax=Emcibacter sp. TaxID=1979954 RepID=UPI002AA84AFD|nr:bifunctional proline dehydrogenase/L-glutamate gamma-semialdehyde dehydrogenase PutA [Emcibacter sp.]
MYDLTTSEEFSQRSLMEIRKALRQAQHADEEKAIANLFRASGLTNAARERIVETARTLVRDSREKSDDQGTMDYFLQEFGLSNREGVALMCLAEALLRVPDGDTADRLISEKLRSGEWSSHLGHSDSLLVNASTWGLMLTGRVVELGDEAHRNPGKWFGKLISRSGEPVIRSAVTQAMKIMGNQYVLGRTIEEATGRGRKLNQPGTRFSFDMLGEGARTMADADRYFRAYMEAIEKISGANDKDTVTEADGISVKFSALHPRYEFARHETVMSEMLPRIVALASAAKNGGIGFTIDAEEAERLDISLDIFEHLARHPELEGWQGLGLVVQAYQKRAPYVIDWLVALARETGRQFMVRLVKGAYWDSEIKHAQELGLEDYPVYTRKQTTDLSYQICAERLMAARDVIYPQFATHNAYTVAMVLELARKDRNFEFQRLHGMGHLMYDQLRSMVEKPVPLRVYAPVGAHKDLLPYLVRRLLENGANSSFVNRFMNKTVPVEELMQDVLTLVEKASPRRHPRIPLPADILSASGREPGARRNSKGLDLADPLVTEKLTVAMEQVRQQKWISGPIVGGKLLKRDCTDVHNPANHQEVVGEVGTPTTEDMDKALSLAMTAHKEWDQRGGAVRAEMLEKAADLMEQNMGRLMGLIALEAGRTVVDGLSEVREAVDFCRYYALQARENFAEPKTLPGPTGELNQLSLHGRGVFVCISPWNFPLAIFTGQVAAALAAGNAVIAKPAEQTPLIAAEAVKILHQAGVPGNVLNLMPGDGVTVGAKLVEDERIAGVAFTGSTETAKAINMTLARRDGPIIPLIAETGGQNVMIVDSTALPEQVVDDVLSSAFQSAGQRCSALRVLYLQADVADQIINMLKGAADSLVIGDPMSLSTDVGPVIDHDARQMLEQHAVRMDSEAKPVCTLPLPAECEAGSFFAPRIYEIDRLNQLTREVFGPVLHVIRFRGNDLDNVLEEVRATGYGLTLGVHSRIEGRAQEIFSKLDVGNTYVNRNIVGAVVGVQPFGGQGLSGTGPKAGGPHYLYRFACEKTLTVNMVATGGNMELFSLLED